MLLKDKLERLGSLERKFTSPPITIHVGEGLMIPWTDSKKAGSTNEGAIVSVYNSHLYQGHPQYRLEIIAPNFTPILRPGMNPMKEYYTREGNEYQRLAMKTLFRPEELYIGDIKLIHTMVQGNGDTQARSRFTVSAPHPIELRTISAAELQKVQTAVGIEVRGSSSRRGRDH